MGRRMDWDPSGGLDAETAPKKCRDGGLRSSEMMGLENLYLRLRTALELMS